MFHLILIVFELIFFLSSSKCNEEFYSSEEIPCDKENFLWTSWFNSQDPWENSGSDMETIDGIREKFLEMNECQTIAHFQYSTSNRSNDDEKFYRTVVNQTGLYCSPLSSTKVCPDYKVRFCCVNPRKKNSQTCGQTFRQPNLNPFVRIVNGLEAVPHSFPWAVSLQYKNYHDCGGVIIDQWNVLTAAHCLDYENDLGNYFVRVGAHDRTTSGQLLPVRRLIIHPKYDEKRSSDDIGIIRLAAPITYNSEIQPICLADTILEPSLGTTVHVVGWGNTIHQNPSSSSNILRQARLRVINDCSMYYAYDEQKQICAASNGPIDRDHGSCQGDSGGALYYFSNGHWFAGGVVSYAIGCGRLAFPTVFTKIPAYLGWIRSTINQ